MITEDGRLAFIVTDKDQRIIEVDDAYVELVGRARSALLGRFALSFTFNPDRSRNQPLLDGLAADGPSFAITKRYVSGDGSLVWVQNHVSKVPGAGRSLIMATSRRVARPFGSRELSCNYALAKQVCAGLVGVRSEFGAAVVWSPALEAMLLLYRAEIDGRIMNVDELASIIGTASSVMIRWMRVLRERKLIEVADDGEIDGGVTLRIGRACELALDALLAKFVV